MILQCPACNAQYNVPDAAIGAGGRTVRCKQCAHEWHAMPPQAEMPVFPDIADIAPVKERPAKTTDGKQPPAPASPLLTGVLAASFLMAITTTLFAKKPEWFGFDMRNSIIMTDLSLANQKTDKGTEYAISGKLVNMAGQYMKPSGIRITLVDKEGTQLKQWNPQIPDAIGPQEIFPVSYGPLKTSFASGDRFVVDLGNSLELALRKKP